MGDVRRGVENGLPKLGENGGGGEGGGEMGDLVILCGIPHCVCGWIIRLGGDFFFICGLLG